MKEHTIRAEYDSLAQCSQMTGIPLPIIRQAKKDGCPAFINHRVKLGVLLPWIFDETRAENSEALWGNVQFQHWRAKREKLAHDRDAKKLVDREEIRRAAQGAMGDLFGELERFLIDEAPAKLKGLTEAQIIEISRPLVESFKTKLRATTLKPTDE